MKKNNWVWTKKTQSLKPYRIAGHPVPVGHLMEGFNEYYPYQSWIKKGYVERKDEK